ncbi:MAG TPA: hypothetical protein PK095_00205, partial [Myxococcota bacterium]|nr:hypothetical protein [Myxococcota bacterium]
MSRFEIRGVVTDETPSPGSGEEAGADEPREGDRLVEFFATSEHDRHMREMRPDWQQLLKLLPDNIPPRPGSPGVKFALWVWPSGFTVESEAYGTRATWESPVWSEASTLRRHA